MKKSVEYSQVNDTNRSEVTLLKTGVSSLGNLYRLEHYTAGYEPAGSRARWTNEGWAVRFNSGGSVHGRRFKTEKEAIDRFNEVTTGISANEAV